MRRRAISSRMVSAICRLCSAESCLSGVGIVTPAWSAAVYQTHNPSQTRTKQHQRRRTAPTGG
jgi:hypothetical protein